MYQTSFHGNLVLTKDSEKAPLCADCHDAHDIIPPGTKEFHAQEVEMCGRCHEDAKATYLDSYHGKAYTLGDSKTAVLQPVPRRPPHPAGRQPREHGLPGRTSSPRALSATPAPTRTSPTSAPTWIPATRRSSWQIWFFWIAYVILITMVFSFAAVHTALYIYRGAKEGMYSRERHRDKIGDKRIEFHRFNVFHRWMHFLVITSFTVLVFTGMPLRYKDTPWAQWFMDLFGGVTAAGIYHRIAAIVTVFYFVCEITFMLVMVIRARGKNIRKPGSIMFNMKDFHDLVGMFAWFFGRGPKPQFDRYAYWEKFDYISLAAGTVIIGATGFMMWFPLKTTAAGAGHLPQHRAGHPLQRGPAGHGRHLHLRALLQRAPQARVVPHRQGDLHRLAAGGALP